MTPGPPRRYMLGFTYEARDWPRARAELERAAATAPEDDALHYNLGLLYQRRGLLDEAAAAFARSHAVNPRHLASAGRPRAVDRLAEVNAERARAAARTRNRFARPWNTRPLGQRISQPTSRGGKRCSRLRVHLVT